MATNRASISSKFENLDVPNQDDFQEIFESFVHKDEDKATFAMVEAGTDTEHYVTPSLLRTGLQNLGIITGNCYMPYKEYFEDLDGDTYRVLQKLPIKDSVEVFKNGQLLREEIDYTLDYFTAILTFTAPVTDRNIEVNYWYKNLGELPGGGTDLTGDNTALIIVTEDGNRGYRLSTSDPVNFGNIGADAVDFSYSDTPSSVFGATGESSFAVGTNVTASNYNSTAFGYAIDNNGIGSFDAGFNLKDHGYTNTLFGIGHDVTSMNTTVVGQAANIIDVQTDDFNTTPTKPLFVVGNGTIENGDDDYTVATRSDALVVRQNGSVEAPSLTTAIINDDTTGKVLVTKEWVKTQARPYKVYTATIGLEGSTWIVNELENSIGPITIGANTDDFTSDESNCLVTSDGLFTHGKTWITTQLTWGENMGILNVKVLDTNQILLVCEEEMEYGENAPVFIEIRVYEGAGIALRPFNYMIVRYKWTPEGGQDLDTFTGVVNTDTDLDNKWLGYGPTNAYGYPSGYSISNFYLISGGDNTASGVESCLVDFGHITEDFPDLDIIQLRMAGNWFYSRGTGEIEIEIETYLNGTMSQEGYDFVNTGDPVQHLSFTKNITAVGHLSANIESVTNIGYVTYNKNSLTGGITI